MSYTPTVWETGDTITAEKLNKIEDAMSPLIITVSGDGVLSHTYREILSASENARGVFLRLDDGNDIYNSGYYQFYTAWVENGLYTFQKPGTRIVKFRFFSFYGESDDGPMTKNPPDSPGPGSIE